MVILSRRVLIFEAWLVVHISFERDIWALYISSYVLIFFLCGSIFVSFNSPWLGFHGYLILFRFSPFYLISSNIFCLILPFSIGTIEFTICFVVIHLIYFFIHPFLIGLRFMFVLTNFCSHTFPVIFVQANNF